MRGRTQRVMRTCAIAIVLLCAGAIAGCGSGSATGTTSSTGGGGSRPTMTTVTRTTTETNPAGSSTAGASTSSTASPTSTSSSAAAPSGSPCRATDLALSFIGGQGATGHGELGFALRNTSQSSCHTYGYPGVQFLALSGKPLPTTPTHTTDDFFGHTTLRPLVVGPGDTVSFRLGVSHVGTGGSSSGCTTADGLQVIAPDDTATLRTQIPSGGAAECGGTVTVSPLQPGTTAFH